MDFVVLKKTLHSKLTMLSRVLIPDLMGKVWLQAGIWGKWAAASGGGGGGGGGGCFELWKREI